MKIPSSYEAPGSEDNPEASSPLPKRPKTSRRTHHSKKIARRSGSSAIPAQTIEETPTEEIPFKTTPKLPVTRPGSSSQPKPQPQPEIVEEEEEVGEENSSESNEET